MTGGRAILAIPLMLVSWTNVYSQLKPIVPDTAGNQVLARIGGTKEISAREFQMRYEMSPGFERHIAQKTIENKQVVLVSLIGEKLLAEEARRRGMASDQRFRNTVREVEQNLVRDALYRKHVRAAVAIRESEIVAGLKKSRQQLTVLLASAGTKEAADFLQKRLTAGLKLENLAPMTDSSGVFTGPDTLLVRWGDSNPLVEDVCYALKQGMTSKATLFDDGRYYFMKVAAAGRAREDVSLDATSERKRVEKILRQRKEEERTFEYMGEVLRGRKVEVDRPLLELVVKALENQDRANAQQDSGQDTFTLTDDVLREMSFQLHDVWNKPMVIFQSIEWSVGTTLEHLRESGFGIRRPLAHNCLSAVDSRLQSLVFQRELTDEGYREHLEASPEVVWKVGIWSDACLGGFLTQSMTDTMAIWRDDIAGFAREGVEDSVTVPLVRITILSDDSLAGEGVVRDRKQLGVPVRGFMLPWELGELRNVVEKTPVGDTPAAALMGNRRVAVRVVDRAVITCDARDTSATRLSALKNSILASRKKFLRDHLIGSLADKYGVTIDQEVLKHIRVTSIPAVFYQVLGFGGRMLAFPLLDNDTNWLEYSGARVNDLP